MATCTVPKNRQLKLTCAGCGMICRASRSAMLRHGLPVHCTRPMHPDDLDLALDLLPVGEQYWHDELRATLNGEARRVVRQETRSGYKGARPQCTGCRKFLKHHREHCSRCGMDNAAGAYREGTAGHDDIPF